MQSNQITEHDTERDILSHGAKSDFRQVESPCNLRMIKMLQLVAVVTIKYRKVSDCQTERREKEKNTASAGCCSLYCIGANVSYGRK